MKKILPFALLSIGVALNAQNLDSDQIQNFHNKFQQDSKSILRQNAIIQDANIRDKALNHSKQTDVDHFFSDKVSVKGITDQKSSGRCWMFTSLNVLRPEIMKKYNIDSFDFSHNFLYFYDLLEKSNLFLENIINPSSKDINDREVIAYFSSPVDDGGVWNLFYNVSSKYGFVPKQIMPETAHSESTSQLRSFLNERLRKGGYDIRSSASKGAKEKELRKQKEEVLSEVYQLLALTLGRSEERRGGKEW